MSCSAWINRLNRSDSRLHKEEILREALSLASMEEKGAQIFLALSSATYNPMVTWGVKQVEETSGIVDAENPWEDFNILLNNLYNRKLTGGSAREAISKMSERFDSEEWNTFCVAVLRKDLRAGISDKTLNKILKGTQYEVPVFGCQLATNCEGRPEMVGRKRLEVKLDGVRVLMLCSIDDSNNTSVVSYSRNGKVFDNFGHIEKEISEQLVKIAARIGYTSFVLDGEIVGETFQSLMRQARRKENVEASDSHYHVFDFVPLEDFKRGFWNNQLRKRLCILEAMKPLIENMPHVHLLQHLIVDLNTAEGKNQLERYAKDSVSDGYEGIMIKDLDAPYESRRTTHWLKWKPTITVDLKVVDVEAGTGKNKGRLGALVCEGVDGDRQIEVNVGSGFSDDERNDFWNNRATIIGQTVEILCDAVTQNQDGTYSLRFPRFLRWRFDKC